MSDHEMIAYEESVIHFTEDERKEMAAMDEADYLEDGISILWQYPSPSGVVAPVYVKPNGVRVFRAMEYTHDEDGNISQAYGYTTSDKYHMGERYRGLFGPYENEVFGQLWYAFKNTKETHNEQ